MQGELAQLRHRLHRHPEVGLQLPRTQESVLEALDGLPLEITTGEELTSVTAVLRGGRPGPAVLLRGDMDALPVQEETGLDFLSAVTGAFGAAPPVPPPRAWATPGVTESAGKKKGRGSTGRGNPFLAQVLGEAAVAAARTNTFLGDRYRRLARRRGAARATVAVGRSILIIIWHLLADPDAHYHDLGSDYFRRRIDPQHRTRNHVRQLEALGYTVALTPVT